jgi:hypothetical protein
MSLVTSSQIRTLRDHALLDLRTTAQKNLFEKYAPLYQQANGNPAHLYTHKITEPETTFDNFMHKHASWYGCRWIHQADQQNYRLISVYGAIPLTDADELFEPDN